MRIAIAVTSLTNFANQQNITIMKRTLIITSCVIFTHSAISRAGDTDTIASKGLNEVVVNGERPRVKGQDGIMIVDLPSIVSDKPVNNILEALGYLPGVVNNNGMIGLAWASDVTIILNGD